MAYDVINKEGLFPVSLFSNFIYSPELYRKDTVYNFHGEFFFDQVSEKFDALVTLRNEKDESKDSVITINIASVAIFSIVKEKEMFRFKINQLDKIRNFIFPVLMEMDKETAYKKLIEILKIFYTIQNAFSNLLDFLDDNEDREFEEECF